MDELITLSQSLLDFVNLREIKSADDADDIFRRHSVFLWNRLSPDDDNGRAAIVDLRDGGEDRLTALMTATKPAREKILRELLDELPNASAQATVQGIPFPLAVVPVVTEIGGRVAVKNQWLVTGIHSAVVLGFLELFVNDLIAKLARCVQCRNFYFRSPALRVACSAPCRKALRLKAIATNVAKWRKNNRKQKSVKKRSK